jgi:hypothetical protein
MAKGTDTPEDGTEASSDGANAPETPPQADTVVSNESASTADQPDKFASTVRSADELAETIRSNDSSFTPSAQQQNDMWFVEIQDGVTEDYHRELAPTLSGRQLEVVDELKQMVEEGILTFDLLDLAERVDPEWEHNNLREYVIPLEQSGAVDKVNALDNSAREPVQVHEMVTRNVSHEYVDLSEHPEVRSVINYQWSAFQQSNSESSAAPDAALDPRKAWLYARARGFMNIKTKTLNPRVRITVRQVATPDKDETSWQEDFVFSEFLLPDTGSYKRRFDEYAILIDFEYDNLEVIEKQYLEDALEEELINYHGASLYHDELAIASADAGTPEEHLREETTSETLDGHVPPRVRMPWFDYDVTVREDEQLIRIASLYQRRTD